MAASQYQLGAFILVTSVVRKLCKYCCQMQEKPCEYCSRLYLSGASNLRSLQGMYLKFAENVDILVHIVYAKFYNFYLHKINLSESGNSHNSEINLATSLWFGVWLHRPIH